MNNSEIRSPRKKIVTSSGSAAEEKMPSLPKKNALLPKESKVSVSSPKQPKVDLPSISSIKPEQKQAESFNSYKKRGFSDLESHALSHHDIHGKFPVDLHKYKKENPSEAFLREVRPVAHRFKQESASSVASGSQSRNPKSVVSSYVNSRLSEGKAAYEKEAEKIKAQNLDPVEKAKTLLKLRRSLIWDPNRDITDNYSDMMQHAKNASKVNQAIYRHGVVSGTPELSEQKFSQLMSENRKPGQKYEDADEEKKSAMEEELSDPKFEGIREPISHEDAPSPGGKTEGSPHIEKIRQISRIPEAREYSEKKLKAMESRLDPSVAESVRYINDLADKIPQESSLNPEQKRMLGLYIAHNRDVIDKGNRATETARRTLGDGGQAHEYDAIANALTRFDPSFKSKGGESDFSKLLSSSLANRILKLSGGDTSSMAYREASRFKPKGEPLVQKKPELAEPPAEKPKIETQMPKKQEIKEVAKPKPEVAKPKPEVAKPTETKKVKPSKEDEAKRWERILASEGMPEEFDEESRPQDEEEDQGNEDQYNEDQGDDESYDDYGFDKRKSEESDSDEEE